MLRLCQRTLIHHQIFRRSLSVDAVTSGNRRALAKSITLVESRLPRHQREAESLLLGIVEAQEERRAIAALPARRVVGIAGPPGVGKSTFIEAFCMHLLDSDPALKVAILTIDPSSTRTGGSILGDKTRMEQLAVHPRAFVRPSPSGGALGGLSYWASDVVSLCYAAGYDFVVIETVGVGQSETAVSEVTDMTMLLVPPGGGDDLQGMKKGIMEVADMVVINKADGVMRTQARHTKVDYMHALQLTHPKRPQWVPPVLMCSSLITPENALQCGKDFDKIQTKINNYFEFMNNSGLLEQERMEHAERVMWMHVQRQLVQSFKNSIDTEDDMKQGFVDMKSNLGTHTSIPRLEAVRLISQFLNKPRKVY